MPTVDRHGISLHYEVQGAGPPLLLAHSFLCSGAMWRFQAPELARDYTVITVDARGHGRSGPTRGPFDFYDAARDHLAVLDDLGIDRVVWAGLSMGGFAGLRAALTAPERLSGLILLDTSPTPEPTMQRIRYGGLSVLVRVLGWKPVLSDATALMFGADTRRERPDLVAAWQAELATMHVPSLIQTMSAIRGRDDLTARLAEIATPTLVIHGDQDTAVPQHCAKMLSDGIPGATLSIVPGAGHLSTLEKPAAVTALMQGFMERATAGA